MAFPSQRTLKYMQEHEEQLEEEDQIRQQQEQTYAGAGYGHRLCIPINPNQSLEQQIQANAEVSLQANNIAAKTSSIANTIVDDANRKEFEGKESISCQRCS